MGTFHSHAAIVECIEHGIGQPLLTKDALDFTVRKNVNGGPDFQVRIAFRANSCRFSFIDEWYGTVFHCESNERGFSITQRIYGRAGDKLPKDLPALVSRSNPP